jgi:hypothetical protein
VFSGTKLWSAFSSFTFGFQQCCLGNVEKKIVGSLEMSPTQAKRRLAWATHHFLRLENLLQRAHSPYAGAVEDAE